MICRKTEFKGGVVLQNNQKQSDIGHIDDAYTKLANAIIEQAVKDYRVALRKLNKNLENETGKRVKRDVERFFQSRWFEVLTSIDPKILIQKLEAEIGSKS